MSLEAIVANLVEKVERRFYGKYRGFVVDNADPEKLGRLKLQVPSVLGNEVVTGWAMPCVPYGGAANQGTFFIPENEAGVWVEFEEGDLEFPVWVGSFWSKPDGESELPKPNDGKDDSDLQENPTRKMIKTLKGHTIQFEDKDDEEMVLIVEGFHKHVVTLNKDGIKVEEGVNKHVVTLNKDGITLKDGVNHHEATLDSNGITLKDGAGVGISLETDGDVTIKGANITLEADSAAKLTGAEVNVEATAKLTAKGNPIHLNP
jgi:hypothetical protein